MTTKMMGTTKQHLACAATGMCGVTMLLFRELDFDVTFGNPVVPSRMEEFKMSFLNSLSQTGFNTRHIESVSVRKHISARRSPASGVDVEIAYAPESFNQLSGALGQSFVMTVNGKAFAADVSHQSSSGASSSDSSNTGVIVGAVIGSVVGAIVLAVIIVLVMKQRKSTTEVQPILKSTPSTASMQPENRRRTMAIENPTYEYTV
jgi:hypothetical protein